MASAIILPLWFKTLFLLSAFKKIWSVCQLFILLGLKKDFGFIYPFCFKWNEVLLFVFYCIFFSCLLFITYFFLSAYSAVLCRWILNSLIQFYFFSNKSVYTSYHLMFHLFILSCIQQVFCARVPGTVLGALDSSVGIKPPQSPALIF